MRFSPARQLVAEFLGTLILVGTVVGSGILAARFSPDDGVALLGNTLATGAILVVLILIFGPVSGAHFNPAVTVSMRILRQIHTPLAALFIIAQVAGGLSGTALAHLMFEETVVQISSNAREGSAQWLSEGVATFALLAAIIGTVRFRPEAVAYAVGLVITAGYWWTASTSFANPAVTIGRAFTDTFSGIQPTDVAPFIAAQLIGAGLATALMGWLVQFDLPKRPQS